MEARYRYRGLLERIIVSKYWSETKLNNIEEVKKDSWWWRDIKRSINGEGKGNWFEQNIVWKVGKGTKIKFWHDVYGGEELPLSHK